MPLTPAERQKRYREKLKQNKEKYEQVMHKHRERYQVTKRLVKDLTPKEKANANMLWKLRKREYRKQKKVVERILQQTPPNSPRSDSSLGDLGYQLRSPPLTPLREKPLLVSSPQASARASPPRPVPRVSPRRPVPRVSPPRPAPRASPPRPAPRVSSIRNLTRAEPPQAAPRATVRVSLRATPRPAPRVTPVQVASDVMSPHSSSRTVPCVSPISATSRVAPKRVASHGVSAEAFHTIRSPSLTPIVRSPSLSRMTPTAWLPSLSTTPTARSPSSLSIMTTTPRSTSLPKNKRRGKIGRRNKARVYRENEKLKQDNEKLTQKYEKFKKRFLRQTGKNTDHTKTIEDKKYTILSGAIRKTFKNTKSRKEREVFKKIFSTVDVANSKMKKKLLIENLGIDRIIEIKDCKDKRAVLKNKLKEFYLRDDVSRATAGKKEKLTKNGIQAQKRFMLDSMKNLFKTFMKENQGLRCSYFYFTKNKPFYVISASVDARDMCLCKTHTNFLYKAKALKRNGITHTDDINIFIESTVCNANIKECMYGACDQCKTKKNNYIEDNIKGTVRWPEWIRKEEIYVKDGKSLKTIKNVKEEQAEDASIFITGFENDLAAFKKHVFNIKTQFQNFRRCLENIRSNECVVVVDFSENYNCKYSQEIQSHHFGGSRKQISLHTVVVYTFDEGSAKGYKVNSFCSISASNNHQPAAIWTHLDPILKWITSNYESVDTVHFYSDGPSTQYRQKQNFYLMCTKFYEYGFANITWSFFEAGHGKGPADGIGGFLKRTADKIIANGEDIADVFQFFEKMNDASKIKLYLIAEKDIEEQSKILPKKIPRLMGTLKVHQVFSNCYGKLKFRDLSCFCETDHQQIRGFCKCLNPKAYDVGISNVRTETQEIESISNIATDSTSVLEHYNAVTKNFVTTETCTIATKSVEGLTKQRYQATTNIDWETTSNDDDEPLLSLKIAKQLQDMTKRHQNIYNDIYGSSSDADDEGFIQCTSHDAAFKIGCGDFLLVKVYVDANRKKSYIYACKALSDIEEDGEVKVMFLRVVDENAKRFRLDEEDISYVDYDDIIKKLAEPSVVKRGHRSYYQFKYSLEVFEKK